MRILFVSDVNSPHVRRWVEFMIDKGHHVSFLSVRPGMLENVNVTYVDPGDIPAPRWLRLYRHGKFLFTLWRMIKRSGFDIVHLHYLRADLTGWVAAIHKNSVISVWGSDVRPFEDGGNPRFPGIRRRTLEKATVITATNNFLEKLVRNWAPAVRRTEVIPFGVKISRCDRPTAADRENGGIHFCFLKMALIPIYGPDILIRAFASVVKKFPDARLTMTGDFISPFDQIILRLVDDLLLSGSIDFVGRVQEGEIALILKRCDVLVQASRWESFGVVILEAFAAGLPAIATDVGGSGEIVKDGITGLLVPPEDVDALAQAMIKLAGNQELRERLGQNGRQLVEEKYNFDFHAQRMESLYFELVGKAE